MKNKEWYKNVRWDLMDEKKTELVLKSAIEAGMIVEKSISSVNQKSALMIGLVPVFSGLTLQGFQVFPYNVSIVLLSVGQIVAFISIFIFLIALRGKPIYTPYRRSYDLLKDNLHMKSYLMMIHGWLPAMDKETLKDQALLKKKNHFYNAGNVLFVIGVSIIVIGIVTGAIVGI